MSVSIAVEKIIEQNYSSFSKLLETDDYTDGNYDVAYYAKMQQIFRGIKEKSGVKFLYCGKRVSEDEMIYLFDGENPNSKLFSPLGSRDKLLTGLHSKGHQERFLDRQIKKSISSGKQFPLIMIDFDDFKLINDEYGHQFGDTVLKAVSEIIKICTRSVDCCAGYGGDEFVIILPEADLEYAALVCQWLLKEVSSLQLKTKNDVAASVSISIGIAVWKMDMTAEQIMVRADKALYHSKRTGKNKAVIYTDDLA